MHRADRTSTAIGIRRLGLRAVVAPLGALAALVANAQPPDTLDACAKVVDDAQRLVCYDRVANRPASAPAKEVPAGRTLDSIAQPVPQPADAGLQGPPAPRVSFLSKFWELDDGDKRGVFNYTGYRPNFLLPVHVTNRINQRPVSPSRGQADDGRDYQKVDAKLQLSLRTKVAEDLLLPGADVWVAYTQQSLWQVYNQADSRPFRETDYEPEAMYVVPTPSAVRTLPFGWQWRYTLLSVAHQSNGQSDPLSRSWNRTYLGLGFEHDNISLSYRINKRFSEDEAKDDNPDLLDYRGRHELSLAWTPGRSTALVTWRTNFNKLSRGGVQLDWTYPISPGSARALRWYAQVYTGYGETLIDYNFRQTSIGLGLTLFEF